MSWPPALHELPQLPAKRHWNAAIRGEALAISFREAVSVGKFGCLLDSLFLAVLLFGFGGGMIAGSLLNSTEVVLVAFAVSMLLGILLLMARLIWRQTTCIRITRDSLSETNDGPWGGQTVSTFDRADVRDVRIRTWYNDPDGSPRFDCVEVELQDGSTHTFFPFGFDTASQQWLRELLSRWSGLSA